MLWRDAFMGKKNNLHVASSTPIGGGAVVVDRGGAAILERMRYNQQYRENVAARGQIIADISNANHYREMMNIISKREYGNKKTSRRLEVMPELHLLVEIREILSRGAFPKYYYDKNGSRITRMVDKNAYSHLEAGEYCLYRKEVLGNFDGCLNFMIMGFTAALKLTMDHYPAQPPHKGSLKHYLAREFVDQINRRSARDVEVGAQLNFIEDPDLLLETNGTFETMKILDECYSIIENIEGGLVKYEAFNDENYVSPAAYPAINEQEAAEFMARYRAETHNELANFFIGFDPDAIDSLDFMCNVMLEMKGHLLQIDTPFGDGSAVNYSASSMKNAGAHIEMSVDAKNCIRKKGQILAALAYCLEQAWIIAPDSQTLGSWELYRFTVDHWFINLVNGWDVGALPDDEVLFNDEGLLTEIFWNEPDAVELLALPVSVYSHAKQIMQSMEAEYDAGNMPMWNFKRDEWWDGQIIMPEMAVDGSDYRMTVDTMYSEVNQYLKEAVEANMNILKPYRAKSTPW